MATGNEKPFATVKVRWLIVSSMERMERKRRATIVCRCCGAEVGREACCPECGSPMSYSLLDWKRQDTEKMIKCERVVSVSVFPCVPKTRTKQKYAT